MTLYGNSRVTTCHRCGAAMIGRSQRLCWTCTDKLVNAKPFPAQWAHGHEEPVADAVAREELDPHFFEKLFWRGMRFASKAALWFARQGRRFRR